MINIYKWGVVIMKRLVLAIIVVFCMQLGFIAYTVIDRPIETLVSINEVPNGLNPFADIADIPNVDEVLEAEPNITERDNETSVVSAPSKRLSRQANPAPLAASKSIPNVPALRTVNRRPQTIVLQNPSKTVLVTDYSQAMSISRNSEIYQLSAQIAPKSKKRSFLSKSFSVIKKPYDWMKALGSKIR